MTLAEWIRRERIARSEVATQLGVSPAYITNLCSDEPSWPSRDLITQITSLTDGAVTANDFLPTTPAEERLAS